jgi:hypothetical protein
VDATNTLPESVRLEHELRRDLASGEQILWQAMPDPNRLNLAFGMWLFAIPWTAFSLAWTGIALYAYLSSFGQPDVGGAPWWGWVFPLFGTPFIAVGIWMLRQPFTIRADAAHTLHALTDRRLVTLSHRKVRTVKSVELKKLGPMILKERADGVGNLSVETGSTRDSDGDRVTDRFEIIGVPGVARLQRLILEQRAQVT